MLPIVVHPAVLHFPLAMLFSAWVCLLTLHATGDDAWDGRVRLFELVGVATAPVAIVTGFVDDAGTVFDLLWDDPVIWHALTAIAASLLYAGHWWWRRERPAAAPSRRAAALDVSWATAAMWLFVVAGLLGGDMVHG